MTFGRFRGSTPIACHVSASTLRIAQQYQRSTNTDLPDRHDSFIRGPISHIFDRPPKNLALTSLCISTVQSCRMDDAKQRQLPY